ncbi:GGDEF domain-containing protein [Raoultibacter phocaeensis]|uniref:GGDEF domain-containing protein n=1 Tax=Raoultibacter phocaeensis TaxID=2479841 RepID=UPI0015D64779|nr:GGDEF domain-containing protein [Raoultibacter phocaeensis]
MELAFGIGTSIVVVVLALIFVGTDARFVRSRTSAARYSPAVSVAVVIFCVAPFLVMALVQIPYVVMYCGIWVACAAATRLAEGQKGWSWLVPNITASLIMLSHLVVSAVFAVCTHSTLHHVAGDPFTRCLVLGITVAVVVIVFRALQTMLDNEGGSFSGSTRALTWFSWMALAYIAFDALSLDIAAGSEILSLFSLLSGVLVGIGIVAFLISASRLGRTAHLEQEYLRLAKESKAEEEKAADLRHRAYSDALTGLASRRSAIETIQSLLSQQKPFTAVFIDMNDLKSMNDALGHTIGDACLIRLASALRGAFGSDANISRIGGDEFLVVLDGHNVPLATACARTALDLLACPNETTPALSFCFGIVDSADGFDSPSQVLERSDLIMYEYKKRYHRDADGTAAVAGAADGTAASATANQGSDEGGLA